MAGASLPAKAILIITTATSKKLDELRVLLRDPGLPFKESAQPPHPSTPATCWRFKRRDQLAMMRDQLLKRITALPSEVDVGVQIGDGHVDIADLMPWGDGSFIALKCHPEDLRDLLLEMGLPKEQRRRIAPDVS